MFTLFPLYAVLLLLYERLLDIFLGVRQLYGLWAASVGQIPTKTVNGDRVSKIQVYVSFSSLRWPRHKDGRRTHAQSSLPQRAPRRKAPPWCSKKALQRSAEEAACTSWNQSLVTAAGGLRPRQLVLISEKSQS